MTRIDKNGQTFGANWLIFGPSSAMGIDGFFNALNLKTTVFDRKRQYSTEKMGNTGVFNGNRIDRKWAAEISTGNDSISTRIGVQR